jgi:AcrR family transcriptional regulator
MNDRSFIYEDSMRDGTATKLRIRQEALRLFVDRGVDAVSVRDIADIAGIRPSTLYVHWRTKDDLVADLFMTGYADYAARIRDIAAGPGAFRDRLIAIVGTICRLYGEDETLFRFLLLTQHRQLDRVPHDENNPVEIVQRMIDAAMRAGEIPAADPALTTAAIVGIIVHAATFRVYGRISRSLTAMVDEIGTLCLRVVAP